MTSVSDRVFDRLKHIFGEDSFKWLDRSYVVDWSFTLLMWFIAGAVKQLPPYEREFDRNDPVIDHKHHSSQIGGTMNWNIAFFAPLVLVVTAGLLRRSAIDIHHGVLALWAGMGFSEVITEVLKNRVGRLRPDFLHTCKWDKTLKACTGKLEDVLDGRRSFPSGHSSTAFSGMMFLSLWIAGATGAWCITRPAPGRSFLASRLARLTLSLLPLCFAAWVAISRLEDYRHHKEDVIVGSIIGMGSATVCYLTYWPSPFSYIIENAQATRTAARARLVYTNETARQTNGYDYELAGMGHTADVEQV